ncbi:MAG: DUF4234 domain-containing protein [Actinomycetota bacterium]|nr:DUF4234 domain-containing protein [Actinomycetota bacterium]
MRTSPNAGPVGHRRGIGFGIFMFFITLGVYSWYWVYETQQETRRHTGQGVGGVLGLVIWILVGFVSAFLIPYEVGKMYERSGGEVPVSGWTGLWLVPGAILIVPALVWFARIQGALNSYWTASAPPAGAAPTLA